MVIFVINYFSVVTFKSERDAPISTDVDSPGSGPIAAQFVQPEPGQVHVLRLGGCVEPAENETKPLCVGWLYSGGTAGLEKSSKAFVLEAPDH